MLTSKERDELKKLLKTMHQKWLQAKEAIDPKLKMPPKYHYLRHCVDWSILWNMSVMYCNESNFK